MLKETYQSLTFNEQV